jgi:hypothetical protein
VKRLHRVILGRSTKPENRSQLVENAPFKKVADHDG